MYFDAVLNAKMEPLFNGIPDDVKTWVKAHESEMIDCVVCIGKTMEIVTVSAYLD